MTLVEQYNEIAEELIRNDKEIQDYERNLRYRFMDVKFLILGSQLSSLVKHPIRLVRTWKEICRLDKVDEGFHKVRYSKIDSNIDWNKAEEFGDDLERAAKEGKIANIKEYMKNNVIEDEKINKKLLKL